MLLEGPTECERPRDAHAADNATRGRTLRTADQANERGFPRPVAAQNPNVLAARQREVDVVEYLAPPLTRAVDLAYILESQHFRIPDDGWPHSPRTGRRAST